MKKAPTQFELVNVYRYGGESVSIGIRNGQITYVGPRQGWQYSIDGQGHSVFCGRIDSHVHDRTPGQTHKEDIESIQRAAIAGGTTAIAAMANTHPCITTADRFLEKTELAKKTRIGYYQWFGATPHNYCELPRVVTMPGFVGIKLCMANTTATAEMLIDKRIHQARWCKLAAEHDVLLAVHAEDEARIIRRAKQRRQRSIELNLQHHCEIRDSESEVDAVRQILSLAWRAGCRLHICHVSTSAAVCEIGKAASRDLRVTFELCPQYWQLNQNHLDQTDGWRAKCNPPLRSIDEALYMKECVCNESMTNAIVATDHAPHRASEKVQYYPDPFRVPSGLPGLDTATSLCWELVHQKKMSRQRFASLTARNPARVLRLPRKGKIAEGYDADLMLIDENAVVTFRDEDMLTKCGWTPFNNTTVHGQVKLVIARGQVLLNRL